MSFLDERGVPDFLKLVGETGEKDCLLSGVAKLTLLSGGIGAVAERGLTISELVKAALNALKNILILLYLTLPSILTRCRERSWHPGFMTKTEQSSGSRASALCRKES